MGATWEAIPGVSAWAVEFADGGRAGWAAGGGGRIWKIEWPEQVVDSRPAGIVHPIFAEDCNTETEARRCR